MAEPIEMPFGLWTRVGQSKQVLRVGAQLRHLLNTIAPSMCGGDVVFCQITLTIFLFYRAVVCSLFFFFFLFFLA